MVKQFGEREIRLSAERKCQIFLAGVGGSVFHSLNSGILFRIKGKKKGHMSTDFTLRTYLSQCQDQSRLCGSHYGKEGASGGLHNLLVTMSQFPVNYMTRIVSYLLQGNTADFRDKLNGIDCLISLVNKLVGKWNQHAAVRRSLSTMKRGMSVKVLIILKN